MTSSAIAVSGLRKAFGDKTVLDGIDLDVRAGTVFSLLGPNGAGKTTTVNVLTTLMKADAGTVRVAGHDVAAEAQLYWLLGDEDFSAAAIADAERRAERVTWPDALVELALSKAELARWGGNAQDAHHQLGVATAILGGEADRADIRAITHDLLGYLTDDLGEVRTHREAACQAASEAGYAPLIAQVLVGVADLALRRDEHDQAARLLAASAGVRGLPDRSHPDAAQRGSPRRPGRACR
jgi:energy-coupling factor transporter ATP-binding protein EcfA2